MAKDPAFLFYPGDASDDTQFMNRLERGAYFDLVKVQRRFHGFTVVQLRKILGKDFDEVWPSIELILEQENDTYFIGWVRQSIEKRENFNKKQSDRIKQRWNNDGNTVVLPKILNENRIEIIMNVHKKISDEIILKIEEENIRFSEIEIELRKSESWQNDICRASNINPDQFQSNLTEFLEMIKANQKYRDSLKEIKSYFANWVKKKIKDKNGMIPKNTSHLQNVINVNRGALEMLDEMYKKEQRV